MESLMSKIIIVVCVQMIFLLMSISYVYFLDHHTPCDLFLKPHGIDNFICIYGGVELAFRMRNNHPGLCDCLILISCVYFLIHHTPCDLFLKPHGIFDEQNNHCGLCANDFFTHVDFICLFKIYQALRVIF